VGVQRFHTINSLDADGYRANALKLGRIAKQL